MKYWADIKQQLSNPIALASQLLLLMLGGYVFIMASESGKWKVPVLFIGLLSWFLLGNKKNQYFIWFVLLGLLSIDLYNQYFWVANHHFMLTLMVLTVISYNYHKSNEILSTNIQLIVAIVILTSVMQKMMSTQFMTGGFYYQMFNQGALFKTVLRFFPESIEIARMNSEHIMDLRAIDPNNGGHIVLKDIMPNLNIISRSFAWITVMIELLVGLALLFKPKNIATHVLFIIMIIGILLTRFETGFMSLLAICGIFLCKNIYLRLLYVMIVAGCFVLMVTKIGFH